jgi:hypothetical protein
MSVATAMSHLARGIYLYAEVLHQDHRSVEAALAIGLPLMGVIQLLTITALAGGVLDLGASDDAPPAISQASARRIVVRTPRLR